MIKRICDHDSFWYCEIKLELHEWPPLDDKDEWLNRPIRQWILLQHFRGSISFGAHGSILFQCEDDAVMFQLAWYS